MDLGSDSVPPRPEVALPGHESKHVLGHVAGTPLAPGMYVPLSEPAEVWHFDLRSPPEDSAERTLDLTLARAGVLNAVAFWFKLHLIDGIELSTGPVAVSAGMPPFIAAAHPMRLAVCCGSLSRNKLQEEPGKRAAGGMNTGHLRVLDPQQA